MIASAFGSGRKARIGRSARNVDGPYPVDELVVEGVEIGMGTARVVPASSSTSQRPSFTATSAAAAFSAALSGRGQAQRQVAAAGQLARQRCGPLAPSL